jgi:ribosomal silencing factor RsfS
LAYREGKTEKIWMIIDLYFLLVHKGTIIVLDNIEGISPIKNAVLPPGHV